MQPLLLFFLVLRNWVRKGHWNLTFFKLTMTYVPEPAATNIPVRRRIDMESALLIPRSDFSDIPSLPGLHRSINGKGKRCKPLRHPCPVTHRSGVRGKSSVPKCQMGLLHFTSASHLLRTVLSLLPLNP